MARLELERQRPSLRSGTWKRAAARSAPPCDGLNFFAAHRPNRPAAGRFATIDRLQNRCREPGLATERVRQSAAADLCAAAPTIADRRGLREDQRAECTFVAESERQRRLSGEAPTPDGRDGKPRRADGRWSERIDRLAREFREGERRSIPSRARAAAAPARTVQGASTLDLTDALDEPPEDA